MGETKGAAVKQRSLAKGAIAGLIGGLAGTVARTYAERIFSPKTHSQIEPDSPGQFAVRIDDADAMAQVAPARQDEAIRWGYGAAVGAAYGALAEFYPEATAKQGASFGLVLEALDREAALSSSGAAAGAATGVDQTQSTRERGSEISGHVAYGVATELVRRLVRRWL